MKTSSKYRRLLRQRKLRRQRSRALLVVLVLVISVMAGHAAFSKQDISADGYNVISVTVEPGDTLWSIAKYYKPTGEDLTKFVYDIAANNGLDNGTIYTGQTIFVPVID